MPDAVAIVIHPHRKDAEDRAMDMARWLRNEEVRAFFPQRGETADRCQMVLTFGGDGTLLAGAEFALKYDCPLMGINMGTVGFLTEGDPDQMELIFRSILSRNYSVEPRGLLQVGINDEPEKMLALNDAVITRGGYARLIQVETWIGGEHWGTFVADGVIAATPTGSTGYSLSAGGPVIAPGVECIAVTPVCAHSLQHSPCIVPADAKIRFLLRAERDQQAQLQIDGRSVRTLTAGDTVRVSGAGRSLKLARIREYRFFTVLRNKLDEWSSSGTEHNHT